MSRTLETRIEQLEQRERPFVTMDDGERAERVNAVLSDPDHPQRQRIVAILDAAHRRKMARMLS